MQKAKKEAKAKKAGAIRNPQSHTKNYPHDIHLLVAQDIPKAAQVSSKKQQT